MMQNSIIVAVTGGIGSGKSEVCRIISESGYPVFSCDKIYSELLNNKKFLGKIEEEFNGVLLPDGTLNRRILAEKIFANREAAEKLNSITHPEIISETLRRAKMHNISFSEVPLLFEGGFQNLFDAVIVVMRDREHRISSICKRDGISKNQAILRLKSQFNYDICDLSKYYVIHNSGNFDFLVKETAKILNKILKTYEE